MSWFLELSTYNRLNDMFKNSDFSNKELPELSEVGLNRQGKTAIIPVQGLLSEKPSFFTLLFGDDSSTYHQIREQIKMAEADDSVKEIHYLVNSPGGAGNGLFETMELMQKATKPSKAFVNGMATSAAYGIASQTDKIIVNNKATQLGSVGVVRHSIVSDDQVSVTSTNAPLKAPDLKTEEGKAQLQAHLDELHDVFVEHIAKGRNTTAKNVNENFGRGGIVLAKNALKLGMIDKISTPELRGIPTKKAEVNSTMDLKTLEREHFETYQAAIQLGVDQERNRVKAHCEAYEQSKDVNLTLSAIKDGQELDNSLMLKHLTAGMNRSDIEARGQETNLNVDSAPNQQGTSSAQNILEAACKLSGVKLNNG